MFVRAMKYDTLFLIYLELIEDVCCRVSHPSGVEPDPICETKLDPTYEKNRTRNPGLINPAETDHREKKTGSDNRETGSDLRDFTGPDLQKIGSDLREETGSDLENTGSRSVLREKTGSIYAKIIQ